jgi:hypothetical protein
MLRSAETINKRKLELDETYTIRNHTAALGRSATRLPTPQPLFHVDKGQHHSLVLGLGTLFPDEPYFSPTITL